MRVRWLWFFCMLPLLSLSVVTPAVLAAEGSRPNIVLILVDDMGYADISPYGGEIETPALARLAESGLRFTEFHNTGRCCPTRASLMSGLYPHQTGVGHMMQDRGTDGYRGDLNDHCVTIAQVLRSAGYGTYMSGKWHVTRFTGPDGPKHNWPLQRGFDRFFGTITGAGDYWAPRTLTRENNQIDDHFPEGFYYTDAIAENVSGDIREHRRRQPDKPFFCYVAYTAPHWPLHAHQEDVDRHRGKYMMGWDRLREQRFARQRAMGLALDSWKLSPRMPGLPAWDNLDRPKQEEMDLLMSLYAAMVTAMDRGVGRIVQTLEETDCLENTLVFFLSDNGGCAEGGDLGGLRLKKPEARPGGRDSDPRLGGCWANVNNTPFRYWKHHVHEGGSATPLIVHWPEGIPSEHHGRFRRQPGHLIDVMATCVDVADATYPSQLNGHDILPMEGRSLIPAFDDKPIERDSLYWEHESHCAIRTGDWKLVSLDRGQTWELYNLSSDRSELNDVAAEQTERVEKMAAMWQTWAERTHVVPWPQGTNRRNKEDGRETNP